MLTNLKAGTGKPWAGQDKLKASAEGFSIEELLSPALNIGADPPMGSEAFFGENNVNGLVSLECWVDQNGIIALLGLTLSTPSLVEVINFYLKAGLGEA